MCVAVHGLPGHYMLVKVCKWPAGRVRLSGEAYPAGAADASSQDEWYRTGGRRGGKAKMLDWRDDGRCRAENAAAIPPNRAR